MYLKYCILKYRIKVTQARLEIRKYLNLLQRFSAQIPESSPYVQFHVQSTVLHSSVFQLFIQLAKPKLYLVMGQVSYRYTVVSNQLRRNSFATPYKGTGPRIKCTQF